MIKKFFLFHLVISCLLLNLSIQSQNHLKQSASNTTSLRYISGLKTNSTFSNLGEFLTDEKGFALYMSKFDKPNSSYCYGNCALINPPALIKSSRNTTTLPSSSSSTFLANQPVASSFRPPAGVDRNILKSFTRRDGTQQLSYNGMALYYFRDDKRPGDIKAHTKNDEWYLVDKKGKPILKGLDNVVRNITTRNAARDSNSINITMRDFMNAAHNASFAAARNESMRSRNESVGLALPLARNETIHKEDNKCIWIVGYHFFADDISHQMLVYHNCCPVNKSFFQCTIYDTDSAGKKLLGIEYVISEYLFKSLSEEEKKLWHSASYEITSGLLFMPGVDKKTEKETLTKIVNWYGKAFQLWRSDKNLLPIGNPDLMMTFTRDGQVKQELVEKLKITHNVDRDVLKASRADIKVKPIIKGADDWMNSGIGKIFTPKDTDVKNFDKSTKKLILPNLASNRTNFTTTNATRF